MPRRTARAVLGAAFLVACASHHDPAAVCSPNVLPVGSSPAVDCPNDLPSRDDCATAAPSYRADTADVIEQRCGSCHESSTGNPHVFTSYGNVASERAAILAQVYGCRMPPSCAAPLTASERRLLLKWLVCGAPED